MFWRLKILVVRLAIGLALKRPTPDTIPLSGEDQLRARNYCRAYIGTVHTDLYIAVTGRSRKGVTGLLWNGTAQGGNVSSLQNKFLPSYPVVIQTYYGEAEIHYSPGVFLLSHVVPLSWLNLYRGRFLQWMFNRKPLVRRERYDVLRWAYDRGLAQGTTDISPETFLKETSSLRWMRHPKGGETLRYYSLVFESLLGSGDLQRPAGQGYRLAPQALATLSRLEEDNRRHKDNLRQQSIMAVLTFALILVGLPAALDAGRKLIRPEVEQRDEQAVQGSTTAPTQEAPAPD
ncbi:hypothetical protein [Pseudogemmobacter bohemicus]|uniref:hypothetical protein n=1 Tax=Pseudogemmobacter bohemicus TaxID=2250708 RepID=UPI000DD3BA12|nr:hypothetical protein [Pseudogemmobacter bohemicus]